MMIDFSVRLEFKPQDLWIGVFWKTTQKCHGSYVDLWVCILPMVPVHFSWIWIETGGKR